jgi:hypothetical protein
LAVVPLVWWIAQRRATRGTAVVPHLPVLESILTARDTTPASPPWRAVALAAGCGFAVLAAADLRATEPAPRRMLLVWGGDAAAGRVARAQLAHAIPGDDLHLLQAGPAGLRHDPAGTDPETDFRFPGMAAAIAAASRVAGDGAVVLTNCERDDDDDHRAGAFTLEPGPDGVAAHAAWHGRSTRTFLPMLVRPGWTTKWQAIWTGQPIPPGRPLELQALLPAEPGPFEATAILVDVQTDRPAARTAVSSACRVPEPRSVLLVTDGTPRPIERPLIAGLAAMPDLVASAGRVHRDDLDAAVRAQPHALLIGLGVGPSAAPEHDWLCVEPPAGDPLLPLQAGEPTLVGVAERFNASHPISRGLTAAGITIAGVRRMIGSGPAGRRDPRYEPLLTTDHGVAIVAGTPVDGRRVVGVLGDASTAFAAFPSWPRFLRRSVQWISAGRAARAWHRARAGSTACEQPAGAAPRVQLPVWRGRSRGAVRWAAGVRRPAEGPTLVVEPDPFAPAPPPRRLHDPAAVPPRDRRPTPGEPASWPALLAALLLAAAVLRLPAAPASRS